MLLILQKWTSYYIINFKFVFYKIGSDILNKNLLNIIENDIPKFSKGQKLIANYIINHYDKAAFMTASKLGATVGVSEPSALTIVRKSK